MGPSNSLQKEDDSTTDVPGILKRLVRTIAYTFYQPCHIAIFNVLLRHTIVDEDSLSLLMKIDKKQLRSMILPVRADKLVKHKILKEKMEDTGQYLSFTYYYINYHLFLNIIKYKLECMKRKIVQQEDSNRLRPNYTCSNCTKGFTDLDMSRLINMKTGELTCYMCHQPVHENEESKQQVMSRTLLAKFNQQFGYLYKLVDKCCTVEFDDKLLEPTVLRSHIDRAVLSRNSLDANVLDMFQVDRNPSAKTRRLVANSTYRQEFTIKFDHEFNQQNNGGDVKSKTKEFPEWLKHSQLDINSDIAESTHGTSHNLGATLDNNESTLDTAAAIATHETHDQEMMDDIDQLLRLEETGEDIQLTDNDPYVKKTTSAIDSLTSDSIEYFEGGDFVDKSKDNFSSSHTTNNDGAAIRERILLDEMGNPKIAQHVDDASPLDNNTKKYDR